MVGIPVLVVLPEASSLRESAEIAMSARRFAIETKPASLPGFCDLDPSFAAVPLGTGKGTRESFEAIARSESSLYVVRATMDSEYVSAAAETIDGAQIFSDPAIGLFRICPGDPPLGTASDVRGLLRVDTLQEQGLNGEGVAVAIVDTGTNLAHLRGQGLAPRLDPHVSWSPISGVKPGHFSVDHGTMCAFATSIVAPQSVLLDLPVLQSRRAGGSIMDGLLSDAILAYSVLLQMMRTPEDQRPYHALVVNNSWGMFHPSWDFPPGHPGRYSDNVNHPFNVIIGSLAGAGADILFAAGNCGSDCPDGRCRGVTSGQITGANSHPDVLTVAGNDVTGDRVGYSSQGPGAWHNDKPDLSTYTHFLGSEAFGSGSADGGTSTACPVAAGCVAALRTNTRPSVLSSAGLFDALRQTSLQPSGPSGWNADYGHGIMRPIIAAQQADIMP